MDCKIATIHRRFGGGPGPAHSNVVCHFWKFGKCNRNPCRFMHGESPPPNVYHRTPKRTNASLLERPRNSSSHAVYNSMDLRGGSEDKSAWKSSLHANEESPRKRFNAKNTLGLGGSEYGHTCKNSSPGTQVLNMKKIRVSRKCPENLSDLNAGSDASEGETIKKSSKKVCEHWMSSNCVKGDGCQFLHSWFMGDWFSMLAKLGGHTRAVSGIALPTGSEKLYSGSSDGAVRIWDCHTGQSTKVINMDDRIGCLHSEGPWIFVGLPYVIKAWNIVKESGNHHNIPTNIETELDFSLDGPAGQVYAMTVALDMLFAGVEDGSVLAWKGSTENPMPFQSIKSLKGHTGAVTCLTVGDKRLYSCSMDSTIRVWDLTTFQCVHTLNGHSDAVMSLICWDQYLLSCSSDQTIKVWAATERGTLEVIYTHDLEHGAVTLNGMCDTEARPILFCSCDDNSVYLYDLPSFNERGRIFSKRQVGAIHVGPGGLFFTCDRTGMLTVWKLAESSGVVPQVA